MTKRALAGGVETATEFDAPGKFVTLAGYEWHSTGAGDYHILFPDLDAEYDRLRRSRSLAGFRAQARLHHDPASSGQPAGTSRSQLRLRDPEVSPVLEIYSEWGNAEHDRAPFPYIRHTEGGRWTKNTLQYLLAQGHRVGVIASTDDHLGFPAPTAKGWPRSRPPDLTREPSSRPCARAGPTPSRATASRWTCLVNGQCHGPGTALRARARNPGGGDRLGPGGPRRGAQEQPRDPSRLSRWTARSARAVGSNPVLVRFEYGWGPWPALGIGGTCDWDIRVRIQGGRWRTSSPASRPDRWKRRGETAFWNDADRSARAIVYRATPADRGHLAEGRGPEAARRAGDAADRSLVGPKPVSLTQSLEQLAESGEVLFTGEFPRESALVHRLVHEDTTRLRSRCATPMTGGRRAGTMCAWFRPTGSWPGRARSGSRRHRGAGAPL